MDRLALEALSELSVRESALGHRFDAARHPRGPGGRWRATLEKHAARYERIAHDLPGDKHALGVARSIRQAAKEPSPKAALRYLRSVKQGAGNVLDGVAERHLGSAIRDIEKDLAFGVGGR